MKMKKRCFAAVLAAALALGTMPAALADGNIADWNGHRYERIEQGMTWQEAVAFCEERGGHLATITSEGEQKVIQNLVGQGIMNQYWLGGTDEEKEGDWKWITGEDWSYWHTTVTFNNFRNEDYLQMERHHWGDNSKLGVWNDINPENHIDGEEEFFSTEKIGIICEYERIGSGWAQTSLEKAEELGLVPESLVGADLTQPITRLEFAGVAVKTYEALAGTAALPALNNPFTDCRDVEVLKAYNLGVVKGTSETTYSPDMLLNREQAATMLTNVFKRVTLAGWTLSEDAQFAAQFNALYTRPAPFADDKDISDWAKDSVYFMAANDIIVGMGNGRFAPKNVTPSDAAIGYANATREQALLIALKMVKNLEK